MKHLTLAIVIAVLCTRILPAATSPVDLERHAWPAVWITTPNLPGQDYAVLHFRKVFELSQKPAAFVVRVTADNRYRLFVNGKAVGRGPARGDPMHWRYDTIDIASALEAGSNVLAAEVWNAAESKPWAQMSVRTGFLLQGAGPAEQAVNTDATWVVSRDESRRPELIDRAALQTFIVSGDGDRVEGSRYPWGWETRGFDDSAWTHAVKTGDAVPYGRSTDVSWWLVANKLPPMAEQLQTLARVRRCTGVSVTEEFLRGARSIEIPEHSHVSVLFDQGFETNAYPQMTVTGGAGAEVRLRYAEALVDAQGRKHQRDEVEGMRLIGKADMFRPEGGANRVYETLWFRTYRYVELQVDTAEHPLTLQRLVGLSTGYPFERRAVFASDDPRLEKIWDIGWRTAKLCAHETYFDCPYYEQLQYVGDTRIQALISLYVAGDDRLVRNAIEQFDQSRISDGVTQSRYPSASPQIINTFSLFWVEMLHDYWMHRDDPGFVAPKLEGARTALDWFIRKVDTKTGMLGPLPYWSFVDWPDEWPWSEQDQIGGQPPGVAEGGSAIISLQLAMTLRDAAELFAAFGEPELAARYLKSADNLNRETLARCWDPQRKMLADTPDKREFSQHANALAVLSGALTGAEARDLIGRVADDSHLVQCSNYFRFYLLRAMKKAGWGDRYVSYLAPWEKMMALGLSTFAEREEPTRSDCHAWSASPCYEFLATVCGVEPGSPGFKTVRIEPHLGPLKHVSGSVPTDGGEITVMFARVDGRLQADITLPAGKTGTFVYQGRSIALHPGAQHWEE